MLGINPPLASYVLTREPPHTTIFTPQQGTCYRYYKYTVLTKHPQQSHSTPQQEESCLKPDNSQPWWSLHTHLVVPCPSPQPEVIESTSWHWPVCPYRPVLKSMNKAVHTVSTAITRVGEACSHYRPVWQALVLSRSSTGTGLRSVCPWGTLLSSTDDV